MIYSGMFIPDSNGILLGNHTKLSYGLMKRLIDGLELTLNKNSCECETPEYCFFEILKKNQLLYFNNNKLLRDGEIDSSEVEKEFDKLWNKISLKQKALLLFLDSAFYNTPLLNMAFWNNDFDVNYYIKLMCSGTQPDSDDEQFVRSVSTFANYFMKIN
jgi:hypothetical protein